MRVFVAGATGAIGRPLIARLRAAGHDVMGISRSEERAQDLRAQGAQAVMADVFDADAVREAMTGFRTEVAINQLTALPERMNFRDPHLYDATNRLRTEGTRILLDGARASGARRLIVQSIAFATAPKGPSVLDEDAPLFVDAPGGFGEAVRAVAEMERTVVGAEGLDGLVLRYGFFYGPNTHFAPDGSTGEEFRRRRYAVVGKGTGVFSFIHVDDAADATVVALERGGAGVYNIVDDEPAAMSEWVPAYAEAIGAPKPRRVPVFLARLVAGKQAAGFATQLRGASNAKAKRELGWEPANPSWRQGFREALG